MVEFNDLDVFIMSMVNELANGKFEYRAGDMHSNLISRWYLEYRERVQECAARAAGVPEPPKEVIKIDPPKEDKEDPKEDKEDPKEDKEAPKEDKEAPKEKPKDKKSKA